MTQRLTIPGRFQSLNDVIASAKSHPLVYAKEKRTHTQKVMVLAMAARLKKIERPCCIRISWYEQTRRRDQDNIAAGGTKPILDGLQEAGILPTDGWKWITGLEHRFHIDKDNPRIEVDVMEEPK